MRLLPLDIPETRVVQHLLESSGLLPTVLEADSYVEEVGKEFYANLTSIEFCDCGRHCVFVHGSMYECTPEISINSSSCRIRHMISSVL